MARGRTLGDMLFDLRAEIGAATDSTVGQSENPALMVLLRRTQESLVLDFDWPHLQGQFFDLTLAAGQRYYDFPVDLQYERAMSAAVKWSGIWQPMKSGFGPLIYNTINSEIGERSDPALRWRVYNETQFEVWPIPATPCPMRFTGSRSIGSFNQMTDKCVIDGTLVVLFAAAERLAGKPRGKALAEIAARYLANAHARAENSSEAFRIGSDHEDRQKPREMIVRVAS